MNICCCCFKGKSATEGKNGKNNKSTEKDIELSSNAVNSMVMCKVGACGKQTVVNIDSSTNIIQVSGRGTVLGSCALDCDTAFWQVKVGNNPSVTHSLTHSLTHSPTHSLTQGVKIGVKRWVAKKPVSCDDILSGNTTGDEPSWILNNYELKTGDVIGVYWDQTDFPILSFTVNSIDIPEASVHRIRPAIDILPAVSVEKGSSCEIIFDGNSFTHKPKSNKFKMIVCATSLI